MGKYDDKPLNNPYKSTNPKKKYDVIVMDNNKRKKVSFGAAGMDDWRSGKATKEQRASFRARMKGIKKKDGSFAYKDKTSPAYWSLNYSW
tara:strand:- start:329 stop:598 length:270 start_codon:yes stop_codon:yes gene_type:complete